MMHDLFCVLANSGFLAHLPLLIYFAVVNFSHFPISDKHAHIELMSANESVLFWNSSQVRLHLNPHRIF